MVFRKLDKPTLACWVDASFGNRSEARTQGGCLVGLIDADMDAVLPAEKLVRAVPMGWRSGRQRRRSQSTAGAELLALRTGCAMLGYLRGFLIELGILNNDAKMHLFSDAHDVVLASGNWKRPTEANLQADYFQLRESVTEKFVAVHHIPGARNVADCFTKDASSCAEALRLCGNLMRKGEVYIS